jgi:hypothetical protein
MTVNLTVYFVDTGINDTAGSGNPAAVCIVDSDQWISAAFLPSA